MIREIRLRIKGAWNCLLGHKVIFKTVPRVNIRKSHVRYDGLLFIDTELEETTHQTDILIKDCEFRREAISI